MKIFSINLCICIIFYNYYMEFKVFCTVLLLLFCLGAATQAKSQDNLIQIGEKFAGQIPGIETNNTVVAIELTEQLDEGYMFFEFQLPLQDFWKKTKLTIFNVQKKLLECSENDKQICYLETSKIKPNSILAINIQCQAGCEYSLTTSIESVKQIKDEDELLESFDQSKIQLYKFKVPTLNENQQVQFTVLPADSNDLPERIKIYANTNGKLPNSFDSQFAGLPIWGGGQGLFLNQNQVSNKELLIMLSGKANSARFYISADIKQNGEEQITFGEYYHDYLSLGSQHIMKLSIPQKYDNVYSLQFVIFEGQIEVGLFTDKQCQNTFKYKPIIYKGSVKYIFSVDGIQKLYVKTESKNSSTTYNILLVLESRSNIAKIEEGVFTLTNVQDILYMYKTFQKNDQIKENDHYLFQLVSIQLKKVELNSKIYLCSSEFISGCFNDQKINNDSTIQIQNIERNQKQNIIQLKIKVDSALVNTKKHIRNRKFMLIVQYQNKIQQESYFGVLIKDLNQIRYLKPKEYIFTTLNVEQDKYFLFQNKNKNTGKIEVHFRVIQGKGQVSLYRTDPRRDLSAQKASIIDQYGAFNIIENLNDPIYIKISARTQAQFLINALTFSTDELAAKTKVNVPTFQMKKAEQYTMYLSSLKDQVIMIPERQNQIIFSLKATGRVSICSINSPEEACQASQISAVMEKNYRKTAVDGNYYLKIVNLSPTKQVTISIEYKTEATNECIVHALGKLYNDVLSNNQCIRFILPSGTDYEGFFMPAQITSIFPEFSICQTKIMTPESEIKISSKDLEKYCSGEKYQQFKIVEMSFKNSMNENTKLKAFYFLQKANQPLILPQGVNFHDKVPARSGLLKSYIYQIVNTDITSQIKIEVIQGNINAFVNIVDINDQQFKIPTSDNFKFKTQTNSNYYFDQQSIISVNARHLEMQKCQRCGLLIAIYSDEREQGQIVSYGVQVTQGVTNLNEHEPDHQFLNEGSIKYYQYQCKNDKKSVMFDISDNGLHCNRMNLGLQEYPSLQNRIDVSLDNHLEAQCRNNLIYYISVEAIADCPISIVAQSSDFKLTKITEGIPLAINLKEGQISYFTFHHNSKGVFKIISIEEFGYVNLYLNAVTQNILGQITNESLSNDVKNNIFKNFQIKNSFSNAIEIDEKDAGYCDQCLYIGAIQAIDTDIDTTILYLEDRQQIIMRSEKVLFDELEVNETSKIAYYDIISGALNIDVMNGAIRVSVIYGSIPQSKIVKQFSNHMQMQYIDYNFASLIQDSLLAKKVGVHLTIQNIGNQIASFSISNFANLDPVSKALTIKKGIPLTIHMTEQVVCAKGYFPSDSQKVYVSLDKQFISFLDDLHIQVYFDDVAHQLEGISQIVENMIMITYKSIDGKNRSTQYMLCFSNQVQKNSYVELTILQSSKVNVIPPNVWGIMAGQQVFMFHPKKRFGLDILTCKGSSNFSYSGNYEQIISNAGVHHQLDNIRDLSISDQTQRSHVLYFDTQDLTTFIKLDTGLSLVKWIDIDENTEEGLGYSKFLIGNFDFKATKDQLILSWEGLSPVAQTQMKVGQLQYEIYIALSEQQLRSAMHCSVEFPQNFFKSSSNDQKSSKCQMSIKKSDIKKKFDQIQNKSSMLNISKSEEIPNIYIGLTAKARLVVNGTDGTPISDDYKFLYRPLEISQELVLSDKESSDHTILVSIGGLAIVSLVGIIITYVLLKKLVPLISRIRSRDMLAEEPVGQSSKPSMEQDPGQSQKQIQNEDV